MREEFGMLALGLVAAVVAVVIVGFAGLVVFYFLVWGTS